LTDALNGVAFGSQDRARQPPHPVDYHADGVDEALDVAPDASAQDGEGATLQRSISPSAVVGVGVRVEVGVGE